MCYAVAISVQHDLDHVFNHAPVIPWETACPMYKMCLFHDFASLPATQLCCVYNQDDLGSCTALGILSSERKAKKRPRLLASCNEKPSIMTAAEGFCCLQLFAALPAGCKDVASCLQRGKQAVAQEDPELLARKAASLDMQRNRFRRALGGEEDEEEAPPDSPVGVRCPPAPESILACLRLFCGQC